MSQVNYDAMSDAELRTYFLAHRQDTEAFQAHLDRLNRHAPMLVANPGEPDFDEKLQALIRHKLAAAQNPQPDEQTLRN
jgi:hypothetical protein